MRLQNPTEDVVTIGIEGVTFSISPKSVSDDLPDEIAKHWKKTHEFLREVDGKLYKEAVEEVDSSAEKATPEKKVKK